MNVGQQLIIPSNTPPESDEYVTYIVERGDSLYSIANEFDVTVDDIVKYNNLTSTTLSIGQKLLIPVGEKLMKNLLEINIILYKEMIAFIQ